MDDFFRYDPSSVGSKGLVFIGDKVLIYRRDDNTDKFPLHLDLPGGGPEPDETPFDTFNREVMEEFGLTLSQDQIVYVRKYPSSLDANRFAYFPVAKLPSEESHNIHFGDEGQEYMLMSLQDYLSRDDAWPVFQERAKEYQESVNE